jgi:hypothetical protein
MVSAGFMKAHERMCKKNPNNQHQCFKYCKNLQKYQLESIYEYGESDYSNRLVSFTCDARPDVELYSYKLERYEVNKPRLECMERMPLECDLYEAEQGHDFSDEVDDTNDLNSEFTFM